MPTRNGEEMGDAPSGKVLRTEENKNSNSDFNIHVDDKSVAASGAASDHDVRYTSILEAIAKSAITTREAISLEVVASGKAIADMLNQLTDQSDKLTSEFSKLQIAFDTGIKSCNDRIQLQEEKLDEFKAQIARELEHLQKVSSEVGLGSPGSPSGFARASSAPSLGGPPSKLIDPNFYDPTIVRINSKNIVERTKI